MENTKNTTNVMEISDLIVEPCDDSPYFTIEELWDMMPVGCRLYYHNNIEHYRHHKMSQTLKAN